MSKADSGEPYAAGKVPELRILVTGFSLTSTECGFVPAMSENDNRNNSNTNNKGIKVRDQALDDYGLMSVESIVAKY